MRFLDERSSVLISKDFTISDFTIPSDFELIIDDGVTIGVDLKISNCQGEDYWISPEHGHLVRTDQS